ncbi:hypothetical protein L2E82_21302 [Cichorium intybus]|uniref:Uncharacterized protein n=1 Tax=Cichorium intybus TaxID=13427 RepID=A0ACB9DVN3_CICIN|nr:hypothetical protein L2E82_21302 [Cichorium intybus]
MDFLCYVKLLLTLTQTVVDAHTKQTPYYFPIHSPNLKTATTLSLSLSLSLSQILNDDLPKPFYPLIPSIASSTYFLNFFNIFTQICLLVGLAGNRIS